VVTTLAGAPIPDWTRSVVAVPPPQPGPGHWAGGPSAVSVEAGVVLAYRLRRPVGKGRGYAVVHPVGRRRRFEEIGRVERDGFGAASLERPALVRRPDGGWRLYVSCSTAGSLHWWVDALDAPEPASFDPARRVTVWPGDAATGVKDPVVHCREDGRWEAWVCCHPLAVADEADRMVSRHATSGDGLSWSWGAEVLAGTPGAWDQRGARITSVVAGGAVAVYDGRASAAENWEERTGIAVAAPEGGFRAVGEGPAAASPHGGGGLRYLSVVEAPGGGRRLYYEATRADGAHEIRTELVP
jgi:hypothetical protein